MEKAIERVSRLYSAGRYREAAEEAYRNLEQDPQDAMTHFLLAEIHCALDDGRKAEEHARACVAAAPQWSVAYWALGKSLIVKGENPAADEALKEAQRLDPEDPDIYLLRASIDFDAAKYADALEKADAGLSFDSEKVQLIALRADILAGMNRLGESRDACLQALALDPECAKAQLRLGYLDLAERDHKSALGHFKEALRLNPSNQAYRSGMLLAMKAGFPVFGLFIRFGLWMGNLKRSHRLALIAGLYFGFRGLRLAAQTAPQLAPLLWPPIALYILFILGTWLADPIMNLLLAVNPYGRYALTGDERRNSFIFAGGFALLLATVVCAFVLKTAALVPLAVAWALSLFGAAGLSAGDRPRLRAAHFAAFMALGLIGSALFLANSIAPSQTVQTLSIGAMIASVLLFALYTWTASLAA